ncbi:molybdate ABC transporter substrate-binding protein [Silvibacterium dinghuense]|uniref:molybdate ABC transporter substrate-binding protein n=1 Tax=Silvibacterium dinghuense TaxID=1560006 RepID=UPI0013E95758|nr:molybdate ABC transporter substrate-binding protein [Silvibacterium dinghuense]GGG95264.1 molybdate ABC transporter substrate-binding protein [Silvibacterium dinghuense]
MVLSFVFLLALAAHAQQVLHVAAAADLEPVLPKILTEFTAATGIQADASYKSSAVLATQILNGAPFDLFMAADLSFPEKVIAAGMAEETQPVVYAQGTLVLWTRNDTPFAKLSPATLEATLRDPAVKTIAVANAEHAPYGRAAQAALTHMGLYDTLKPKLVVAENIAQTAQFVESGNAQLGLISLTSAKTARLAASGHYAEVPREDYPPLEQGAIVVKHAGANAAAARRFLLFLATPKIVDELRAGGLAPATISRVK